MTPQSNSRADRLVYADWLLDQGRDVEAAAVRASVDGPVATAWWWEERVLRPGGGSYRGGMIGGVDIETIDSVTVVGCDHHVGGYRWTSIGRVGGS